MRTLKEIFANTTRVVRNPGLGECWEWSRAIMPNGYGAVSYKGLGQLYVHRLVAGLLLGNVDGLVVRHQCDNRPCLRPEHLELGTTADNRRDFAIRGKPDVLTDDDVLAIREAASLGLSYAEIGRSMGFHRDTVRDAAVGHVHSHVGGPVARIVGSIGENNGSAKLSVIDVTEIRRLLAGGEKRACLSARFGVSPSLINAIAQRKIWRHVPVEGDS